MRFDLGMTLAGIGQMRPDFTRQTAQGNFLQAISQTGFEVISADPHWASRKVLIP